MNVEQNYQHTKSCSFTRTEVIENVSHNKGDKLKEDHDHVLNPFRAITWSRDWVVLAFGQGIALSLACCSIASAQLQSMNGIAHMPLFQVSFGYFVLQIHFYFIKRTHTNMDANQGYTYSKDYEKENYEEGFANESSSLLQSSLEIQNHDNQLVCHDYLKLQTQWYFYALVAFLDVQANYFVILSFRYTAVVNSTILTSLSIISVMASSRWILGKKFKTRHFLGAIICIIGASCVISLDFTLPNSAQHDSVKEENGENGENGLGSKRYIGDIFAVLAALLFGLNDSLAEYTIQSSTPDEYLAMMGMFGFLFSFCESLIFENNQLRHFLFILLNQNGFSEFPSDITMDHSQEDVRISLFAIFSLWSWYIVTFYAFYASTSRFLTLADATLLSLSLQTSNLWTMLFSIFHQNFALSPFFIFSMAIITFGVWMYEQGPPATCIIHVVRFIFNNCIYTYVRMYVCRYILCIGVQYIYFDL
jgi:solute carrier family 35 protein F1/2